MINITVNGKPEEIEQCSLKSYFENKNINIDSIIVLLNNEIVKKSVFDNTVLKDNDVLEIVRFVGGG